MPATHSTSTDTPSPWQLYDVDQAAVILDMGKTTLYRLVKDGLPHHNIRGVGVRFSHGDLAAIHAESQRGAVR